MKTSHKIWVFLSSACLSLGCGSWIGNPPRDGGASSSSQVGFQFAQNLSNFDALNPQGEAIAKVTITVNRHVMRDVSFFEGQKPNPAQFGGPYLIDLVAGTVEPQPDLTILRPGVYTSTNFTLAKAEAGQFPSLSADDRLIGHSSHIKGYIEYQGQRRDFEFVFPLTEQLTIQGQTPSGSSNVVLGGSLNQTILVQFDVVKWFAAEKPEDLTNTFELIRKVLEGFQKHTSIEVKSPR